MRIIDNTGEYTKRRISNGVGSAAQRESLNEREVNNEIGKNSNNISDRYIPESQPGLRLHFAN